MMLYSLKTKLNYEFVYKLPKIIYSSLISSVISVLIKYLSLSEKIINVVKNNDKIFSVEITKKSVIWHS